MTMARNKGKVTKPGEKMPDGSVYAGVSPDTGRALYVMPNDEPLTCKFREATQQAAACNFTDAFGHHDWRLPTRGELRLLFKNRASIGGFNASSSAPAGEDPVGYYWSAEQGDPMSAKAWCQRFNDGIQHIYDKNYQLSVRLVR